MLKRTKLRSASKAPKKVKERKEYKRLRIDFLLQHPMCQYVGDDGLRCRTQATDVHHKAGRLQYLNRVDTWMSVCRLHHDHIETNRGWSKERGYLINPLKQQKLDHENEN